MGKNKGCCVPSRKEQRDISASYRQIPANIPVGITCGVNTVIFT